MDLRTDALTVRIDGRAALWQVTVSFPGGERALVVGNAGSGKTTLLKALAGLLPASAGRVLWNGAEVGCLSPEQRRAAQAAFGMVFQSDALFDSLTVLENVMLPLSRRKVPPKEARPRAEEALVQVGLLDAARHYPERLSGGMRKRVGIARAIVARPEVLLADDPLAGLDPETAESVTELLLFLAAERTLILAAPEAAPALRVPTVLRLEGGRLGGGPRGPRDG
ncbi:MAG: ATP-binding cassette domain-containing protein [Myxococcales bacterium]|nr:ATP-binding cassette domain-containing protein [Myxococcales bacterium]